MYSNCAYMIRRLIKNCIDLASLVKKLTFTIRQTNSWNDIVGFFFTSIALRM